MCPLNSLSIVESEWRLPSVCCDWCSWSDVGERLGNRQGCIRLGSYRTSREPRATPWTAIGLLNSELDWWAFCRENVNSETEGRKPEWGPLLHRFSVLCQCLSTAHPQPSLASRATCLQDSQANPFQPLHSNWRKPEKVGDWGSRDSKKKLTRNSSSSEGEM